MVWMDYPRFPILEMRLRNFPHSMKFQSWKVNFKTEVFSKTADLHLTMQWITEVEIANSIEELLTSRTIVGRTDFADDDKLDAMIASSLKKPLDRHVHFRRKKRVEEQRVQEFDRFLRGRQIAHMIYEPFRATGASEAVELLSDLFNIRLQNDDVHDVSAIWDQALLSAN